MSNFSSVVKTPCNKGLSSEGLAGTTIEGSDGEGTSSSGQCSVIAGHQGIQTSLTGLAWPRMQVTIALIVSLARW